MKTFQNWMEEQSGNLSVAEIEKLADGIVSNTFDQVESESGYEEDEEDGPILRDELDSAELNGRDTIQELGGNKTDQTIFDTAYRSALAKYLYQYRHSNFVKVYNQVD